MAGTNGVGRFGVRSYVAPVSLSSIVTNGLVMNLDAGNVASYPGTGTTWTDLSGNGNNGTLVNGTSYSSANGGALAFDGINDYVSVNGIVTTSSYTISAWCKVDYANSAHYARILEKGINNEFTLCINKNFDRKYTFQFGDGSGGWLQSNTLISLSPKYDNVAITVENTSANNYTVKMYINGVFESSNTKSGTFNTNNILYIGGNKDVQGLTSLVGSIGGAFMYGRALSASEVLQNFNSTKERFGYPSYTTRTSAFTTATGITDATILNALNTFDTGLISNGLDTKMKALYPFVGGTANTHKFNFMDARDSDAAFRLQFNGGWVHNATGAKPNGSNGYANTYLSPYTQLTLGSRHLSMYASDNSQANQYSIDMGAYDSAGQKSNHLSIRRDADLVVGQLNNWGNQSLTSNNNTKGLLIVNRPSISSSKAFKNNVLIASTTNDITGQVMPNFNMFLGGSNDNGGFAGAVCSSRGFSLSSIGSGLSDTEASTFYALVQAFQTSLSRAV